MHQHRQQQQSVHQERNSRTERLLYTRDGQSRWERLWERDRNLIIVIVFLMLVINMPYVRYILYPFMIFSTWTHEMCHGIAALMLGGRIEYIQLYPDGGGVCYYTGLPTDNEQRFNYMLAFVDGAGYTGTAFCGCLLLLCRRRWPAEGVKFLGVLILVSCLLFVRNLFGLAVMIPFGIILCVCGWKLSVDKGLGILFAFLAATCCLNAILDMHNIFFDSDLWDSNEEDNAADAMAMVDLVGGTYFFWTLLWYVQAILYLAVGLLLPLHPKAPDDEEDGIYSLEDGVRPSAPPEYLAASV